MKAVKGISKFMAGLAALGMIGLSGVTASRVEAADAAPAKPVLTSADCVKCHTKPVEDIAAKGMAHKESVSCQDCHVGHPPAVPAKKIIPQCSMCHQDKPHYKLPNCLGCHRNPHTPKIISFGNNITDPCLTCHTPQIKQLRDNKSKHTALNCSFCHDVHGKIPQCTQCHKPHSADMVAADCKKCHKAHMPKAVAYGADTPNKSCGACHKQVLALLTASKAKHAKVPCVTCHQAKHKMIPKCQDCHGIPHPAAMMAKFPRCGECHNIAHDLNNWPSEKKGAAKAEERPAAPAKKKK